MGSVLFAIGMMRGEVSLQRSRGQTLPPPQLRKVVDYSPEEAEAQLNGSGFYKSEGDVCATCLNLREKAKHESDGRLLSLLSRIDFYTVQDRINDGLVTFISSCQSHDSRTFLSPIKVGDRFAGLLLVGFSVADPSGPESGAYRWSAELFDVDGESVRSWSESNYGSFGIAVSSFLSEWVSLCDSAVLDGQ